jgi:uncharacterized membrane protein YqjE
MDDQATVARGNGHAIRPAAALGRGVGGFAADLLSLAELQWQLLMLDLRESGQNVVAPLVLAGLAIALGLGVFPVLLIAIAFGFIGAGMAAGWAFLISAVIGLVVAGVLAVIAWGLSRQIFQPINRSKQELAENIRWIKESLNRGGRVAHSVGCRDK